MAGMDTITLTAIARELAETVVGGRVQAVTQPDPLSLALEIYSRGERQWLLLDANPVQPRLHLLPAKARRGVESDAPLLLLARKYVDGARLLAVTQPPWERVLHLHFVHAQAGPSLLAAEIMGRWSNLLLLDPGGAIREALRRFGPGQNRWRVILPGHIYQPPPPQAAHLSPDQVTLSDLERLLNQTPAGTPVWRALQGRVAGLSPLLARELVYRASGETLADVSHANMGAAALLDALIWLRGLSQQGGWAPSLAFDPAGEAPVAFAPYELTHLGHWQPLHSISAAAHAFYEASIGADAYAGRRSQVEALLAAARKKLEGRRASLGEQAVSEEEAADLRACGEWILAYAWQVQSGAAELLADTGAGLLRIPLDPALSAAENAQAYFGRYRKAQKSAQRLPDLLAATDRDLAYLDQLQSDLQLADNAPQIEELREALLEMGIVAEAGGKKRPPMPRSQPLQLRSQDGFTILIGRNARQNEEITWKLAQPEDVWLHAADAPGAHVVIRTAGRQPPATTLAQAASWAAWQSQARDQSKAAVLYTERRHLRKFKGARPGQVRVLQHKSLTVTPAPPPQT